MDIYPAIRVIYESTDERFARLESRTFADAHGKDIPDLAPVHIAREAASRAARNWKRRRRT